MYALFESNGVFQYTGRNLGKCTQKGCTCDVYCAPSPVGGFCTSCKHSPEFHSQLCVQCQRSIPDLKLALHLTCLDLLCPDCASKYADDEDIICPRCNCLTPRHPFSVDDDEATETKEETLQDQFDTAKIKLGLNEKPLSNETLLKIYSLFKQATTGDCNTKKPSSFDIKAAKKWEAWNSRKGMPREQAMQEYVALVNEITQ